MNVEQIARKLILYELKSGKPLNDALKSIENDGIESEIINKLKEEFEKKFENIEKLKDPPSSSDLKPENRWYLGPQDDDIFWPKYKKLLETKGWNSKAIQSVDDTSTKIISYCSNPNWKKFKTKGLVLGYIQSGKTTNYTAVISKAADVGYKFFIILAGLTDSLRKQTQIRLDSDIQELNPELWMSLTSSDSDFSLDTHLNLGNIFRTKSDGRVYCVVKKNKFILERLIKFFERQKKISDDSLINCPVILIDDEADQASINSKKDERSAINQKIIEILKFFNKICYIAYTATPFANLFINPKDEEDLYPRNFIVSLIKPNNYIGPEYIFGRERITFDEDDEDIEPFQITNIIPENEVIQLKPKSSKNKHFIPSMTSSFQDAIKYFILAASARRINNPAEFNTSMMIHLANTVQIQRATEIIVEDYLKKLRKRISKNDENLKLELEKLWNYQTRLVEKKYLKKVYPEISFDLLYQKFKETLYSLKIRLLNYISDDDIIADYENEPGDFIIIGGNKLSRGLTLKGLLVTFFVRVSRQYDTLLQMGRWFGYHQDYIELVRIWITNKLYGFFRDLAQVEKEIRFDIQRYEDQNITPLDLGVRIKTHPIMKITSRYKMGVAIPANCSFSGKRIQTYLFETKNYKWLSDNITSTRTLIRNIRSLNIFEKKTKSHYVFEEVPVSEIIKFLEIYKIHSKSVEIRNKDIIKYLKSEIQYHKFWNVVIISREKPIKGQIDLGLSNKINLINRTKKNQIGSTANLRALVSREDLIIDLFNLPEKPSIEKIKQRYNIQTDIELHSKICMFREEKLPKRGLLLIYPIAKNSTVSKRRNDPDYTPKNIELNAEEHVIGIGIYFPRSSIEPSDKYLVVNLNGV